MPPKMSKEQRLKESRGLRAKAPVAAQFEDCFQAFRQLSDVLHACRPDKDDLHKLASDCKNKLKAWGHESGASSRALDYALKASPQLEHNTNRLLADMYSVLEQGKPVG